MDDLRDRLHQVESNPLPDVWDEVLDRTTRHEIEPRPSLKHRLLVGTIALLIAGVAFAISLPALRGDRDAGTGVPPGSQDETVRVTIGDAANGTVTMSSGATSVAGVPVSVIIPDRTTSTDGADTHSPILQGPIGSTLRMKSFHIDAAAVAAPDLLPISVASDASIASDAADTVVFAFAPPADQTGMPVHWSPTGEGRMIPFQLPSSFQQLSEGPWRLVVALRQGPSGSLFQFAFEVDVQPAGPTASASFTAQDFVDGTAPLGTELANALGLTLEDGFHGDCSWYAEVYEDGRGYCLQNAPGSKVDLVAIAEGLRRQRMTETELENTVRTFECNQQRETGNISQECLRPFSPPG